MHQGPCGASFSPMPSSPDDDPAYSDGGSQSGGDDSWDDEECVASPSCHPIAPAISAANAATIDTLALLHGPCFLALVGHHA